MADRPENLEQKQDDPVKQGGDKLQEQVLILYECYPGGPIVRDPKQCHELDRKLLPQFELHSS